MRRHTAAGLLGATLVIAISACGTTSDPASIDDLRVAIEATGYKCDEPVTEHDDDESLDCGDDIYAIWYPSAADEVASFDAVSSLYDGIPSDYSVDLHMIRGEQWRISGVEGAVTKVAESLDKNVVSISS